MFRICPMNLIPLCMIGLSISRHSSSYVDPDILIQTRSSSCFDMKALILPDNLIYVGVNIVAGKRKYRTKTHRMRLCPSRADVLTSLRALALRCVSVVHTALTLAATDHANPICRLNSRIDIANHGATAMVYGSGGTVIPTRSVNVPETTWRFAQPVRASLASYLTASDTDWGADRGVYDWTPTPPCQTTRWLSVDRILGYS